MIQLNLLKIPNQEFKFQIDEELYTIELRTIDDLTFISISRDNVVLVSNQLVMPNTKILRFNYMVSNGNFVFDVASGEYPDFNYFNVTQFLYYVSNQELEEMGLN